MLLNISSKPCILPYGKFSLNLFNKFYSIKNPILNKIFIFIHYIFKFEYIVFYNIVFLIVIILRFRKLDQNKRLSDLTYYLNFLTHLFIATFLSTIIIIMIKNFISCPRPLFYFGKSFVLKNHLYEDIRPWDSSFPSGHVALVSLLVFFLWSRVNSLFKVISLIILIITMISRINLGLHFPHDVVSSVITSYVIFYVSKFCLRLKIVRFIITKMHFYIKDNFI